MGCMVPSALLDCEYGCGIDKIKAAASVKDARPAIDATQKYVWEELPFTLIGHKVNINAVSTNVKGYDFNLGPVFYNVSVNK